MSEFDWRKRLAARPLFAALLCAALLAIAFHTTWRVGQLHIVNLDNPYAHFDSVIPLKVAEAVSQTGALDTNWAHADLPDYFRYDQFNFSSYILTFSLFDDVDQNTSRQNLTAFSIWSAIAAVLIFALHTLYRRGPLAGAVVACGLVGTPMLVQDSFYGRPEAFTCLLTALVFALSDLKSRAAFLAACCVAGFGIACKISFAPFAAACIVGLWMASGRLNLRWTLLGGASVIAGFVAGVPYAVLDPAGFLHGVRALQEQYATPFPPHGSADAGLFNQAAHASAYFLATIGLVGVALIALACGDLGRRVLRRRSPQTADQSSAHLLVFTGAALATITLFSTQPTFFERNMSHAVAFLWVPLGWFVSRVFQSVQNDLSAWAARTSLAAAVIFAFVRMSDLSISVARVIAQKPLQPEIAAAALLETYIAEQNPGTPIKTAFAYIARDVAPTVCKLLDRGQRQSIVKLVTHRGRTTEPALSDPRVSLAGLAPGPFDHIPVSTLQVYHAARVEFYLLRPEMAFDGNAEGDCARLAAENSANADDRSPTTKAMMPVSADLTEAWIEDGFHLSAGSIVQLAWGTYGSDGDAAMGKAALVFDLPGDLNAFDIPVAIGPGLSGEPLRVIDVESGRVLARFTPKPEYQVWKNWRIEITASQRTSGQAPATRQVRIEGEDNGAGWGEWIALAAPVPVR